MEYIDVPEPRGDDVEIAGAGVCHSNLRLWRGEMEGFPTPLPMALGHRTPAWSPQGGESAGRVQVGTPVLVFGDWYEAED